MGVFDTSGVEATAPRAREVHTLTREVVPGWALALLLALLLAGCGTASPPLPARGTGGFVTIAIARDPGEATPFFTPIHRARLVGADGSVRTEWEVTDAAITSPDVEPGAYRLDVFTVFLGDHMECATDPAAPGGSRCTQATLGPAQVCSLDVVLAAGRETRATFRVLRDGLCGLEEGASPGAT